MAFIWRRWRCVCAVHLCELWGRGGEETCALVQIRLCAQVCMWDIYTEISSSGNHVLENNVRYLNTEIKNLRIFLFRLHPQIRTKYSILNICGASIVSAPVSDKASAMCAQACSLIGSSSYVHLFPVLMSLILIKILHFSPALIHSIASYLFLALAQILS